MSSATPASVAFLRAAIKILSSLSVPKRRSLPGCFIRSSDSVRASRHISLGMQCQSADGKSRYIPGAILRPIRAASIGIVPVPQNGSSNGLSGFQKLSCTMAAASVSFIGAVAVAGRYPRLCRLGPVVSSSSQA